MASSHYAAAASQPHSTRLRLLPFSFLATFSFLLLLLNAVVSVSSSKPIIFSFGDSNSDTGALVAGLGYSIFPPYGRVYFKKSTGRLSDGRLILDFLCQSVNTSLLSAYMESLGSSFTNGANFAVVGSVVLPKHIPFALDVQVMQFLRFKSRSLELVNAGSQNLIADQGFRDALYVIDIGQNDLADSFSKNLTYTQAVKNIPSVILQMKNAIMTLYTQGGRKFWVHNTGPLGCLPQKLWLVQNRDLDQYGCLSSYNDAARMFNEALLHLCQEMRNQLKDAAIVYVDIYSIKYDLIANSTKYGFSTPLMACCGHGGPPYNYNIQLTCGNTGYQVCNEGAKFINWDGIHYTEAANSLVASKVLSMAFSTPPMAFNSFFQ